MDRNVTDPLLHPHLKKIPIFGSGIYCLVLFKPKAQLQNTKSPLMNSQMYCSILKEKMLPSLCALGRRALFQHDNDPKHTSKATVGFLKKNRVKVIQWPSMSPDLNPIEHLWGILKRQVEHHSPSSIQSLKEVILEEWKQIDLAKCRQLVHSMRSRLGAVIKNHGGHTKY